MLSIFYSLEFGYKFENKKFVSYCKEIRCIVKFDKNQSYLSLKLFFNYRKIITT